jgi:hypothetical protein
MLKLFVSHFLLLISLLLVGQNRSFETQLEASSAQLHDAVFTLSSGPGGERHSQKLSPLYPKAIPPAELELSFFKQGVAYLIWSHLSAKDCPAKCYLYLAGLSPPALSV